MNNIMLDLETMGTGPNAVVVAIGAVYFDPELDGLGLSFYETIKDWETQVDRRRQIDVSTIKWWLQQSEEARKELYAPSRSPISTNLALSLFDKFCGGPFYDKPYHNKDLRMWGNGADFDNIIFGSLFTDFDYPSAPWGFYNNRCFRTIKNLGYNDQKPLFEGEKHNALADAIHQAQWARAIYRQMKGPIRNL